MIAIFPELSHLVESRDFETLAVMARKYFAPDDFKSPKVNILGMVLQSGIKVQKMVLKEHGSIVAKDEKGVFEVTAFYKNHKDPMHDRFLLAHLLGHFLIHLQPKIAQGDYSKGGYRESIHPETRFGNTDFTKHLDLDADKASSDIEDREADEFAAALLMPRGMVIRAFDTLRDIYKISKVFAVKPVWIEKRLDMIALSIANDAPNRAASSSPSPIKKSHQIPKTRDGNSKNNSQAHNTPPLFGEISNLKGMEKLRRIAKYLEK